MTEGFRPKVGYGRTADKTSAVETRSELPIGGSPSAQLIARNLAAVTDTEILWERAVGLVGVYRAVNIIATGVSQLPVSVFKDGEEVPQRSTSLIVRPSLDISRRQFFRETVTSLALTGNAYWLQRGKTSPTASPGELVVLNPDAISQEVRDGKKVWTYGDNVYQWWQVKQLMLDILPGFPSGTGPIQAAQNELRGAIDLRNYADEVFSTGGVASGILSTDQDIDSTEADDIADRWDAVGLARGIKTRVLGKGLKWQYLYLKPEEVQFIESQEFSAKQIALLFGIPAIYMLVDPGNSMTYNNAEDVDIAFIKYTLMGYVGPIEDALTDLIPRGQEAKFVVEGLLRADQKTRFESYAKADWMTVNEKRAREGLPPIAGGDVLAPKVSNNPANTNNEGDANGTNA